METRKPMRLLRDEWQAVTVRADKEFKKTHVTRVGLRWNPIRIVAAALFLLITLFTSAKAALHAIPVADAMYNGLIEGIGVTPDEFAFIPTLNTFRLLTVLVMMIISELGMVYFMLLSYQVVPKQLNYGRDWRTFRAAVDLSVLMSYMPRLVTYLMVAFVFYVAGKGGATLTIYDQFLPVLVGIGLTYFVETLVNEWDNNRDVRQLLWDNRHRDDNYLLLLHDYLGEALISVRRVANGKSYRPNEWLETSDELEAAIQAEYRRNTLNLDFANAVRNVDAEMIEAAKNTGIKNSDGLRIPAAERWTAETLFEDLKLMKAKKPLQRADIRKWYAKGHGADTVWLEIADKWNSQ